MTLLAARHLSARYGAAQALFDVSLAVGAGEVVALMGRNGMGKTTTIRCLTGMMAPRAGEVLLDGQSVGGWPSHRIARQGVGLVPEGRRCFGPLSVAENLLAAARPGAWDQATVCALFPRLGERLGQRAASLSGGEQQMLAIARALMTNPRLLVLDEATEGLAPVVRQEIWAALTRLKRDSGLGILIVDKSLRELRALADGAVLIERGRTVWQGRMSALTAELTGRHLGV